MHTFEQEYSSKRIINDNNDLMIIDEPNEIKEEIVNETTIEGIDDILDSFDPATGETLTIVEKNQLTDQQISDLWDKQEEIVVTDQQVRDIWNKQWTDWCDQQWDN